VNSGRDGRLKRRRVAEENFLEQLLKISIRQGEFSPQLIDVNNVKTLVVVGLPNPSLNKGSHEQIFMFSFSSSRILMTHQYKIVFPSGFFNHKENPSSLGFIL
jgi:hypothetical protein